MDMCKRSLRILERTVSAGNHPDRTAAELNRLIRRLGAGGVS